MARRGKRVKRTQSVEAGVRAMLIHRIVNDHFGGVANQFAKAIGYSGPHISRVVNGESNFGVETCLKIATVTNLDPHELWDAFGHQEFAEMHRIIFGPGFNRAKIVVRLTGEEKLWKEQVWDKLTDSDREFLRASLRKRGN